MSIMACAIYRGARSEIDSFLFNDEGAVHDSVVDGEDIFADEADEKNLQSAGREHADHYRGVSHGEIVPTRQLQREIDERDEEARRRDEKSVDIYPSKTRRYVSTVACVLKKRSTTASGFLNTSGLFNSCSIQQARCRLSPFLHTNPMPVF